MRAEAQLLCSPFSVIAVGWQRLRLTLTCGRRAVWRVNGCASNARQRPLGQSLGVAVG